MRPFNMVLHILIKLPGISKNIFIVILMNVSRNTSIETNLNFIHNYNILLHFQYIVRIKKFCNNLLRLKLLHVLESPTNLSSKATKTKERENISNSIFISMSMRCGSAKIFCNESCTLCDQFSQFEKILCMSKTCLLFGQPFLHVWPLVSHIQKFV